MSCIVPVHDCERWVGEALDSILAQTVPPDEVIVVDDGSTDGTAAVLASYGDRIRVLAQANAGSTTARNAGIAVGKGDLIAFLDADDVWLPAKLERQLARFAARPELDFCCTAMQNFWIPELAAEAVRFADHRISRPMRALWASSLLCRRDVFERVGRFDERLRCGGEGVWFAAARAAGLVFEILPEVLVRRRLHTANRSRGGASTSRDAHLEALKRHLDRVRGRS